METGAIKSAAAVSFVCIAPPSVPTTRSPVRAQPRPDFFHALPEQTLADTGGKRRTVRCRWWTEQGTHREFPS